MQFGTLHFKLNQQGSNIMTFVAESFVWHFKNNRRCWRFIRTFWLESQAGANVCLPICDISRAGQSAFSS